MAFSTDHEVTVVKTSTGVDFYSSGVKFATLQNSDGKLFTHFITDPAAIAACGLALDSFGKVAMV